MSESYVDRILVGQSVGGSGLLTRSLEESQTSGFIRDDAPHWSIEQFIPLGKAALIDFLVARPEFDTSLETEFRRFCDVLDRALDDRSSSYRREFAQAYEGINPDRDQRAPHPATPRRNDKSESRPGDPLAGPDPPPSDRKVPQDDTETVAEEEKTEERTPELSPEAQRVADLVGEILLRAGYRRLENHEITRCVGVASQFGVPLHVDLDIFNCLLVYARGDVIGTRVRRRLRRFYRREEVSVQIYQRMVVVFQLCDDDPSEERLDATDIHVRMFKNIPKQDVDTLLPGTKVRISGLDRVRIIVPHLGGFLMSLRRIAQITLLFAVIALHWSAILIALIIGYIVKSTFSYFQTKNKYQLSLTRNLYFQKIDTNAGAVYHSIQQAHQQQLIEGMLARFALLTSDQPLSRRRLRRRCERLVREAIDVEIDFQVDRALEWLNRTGAIREVDGRWVAVDPETSDRAANG